MVVYDVSEFVTYAPLSTLDQHQEILTRDDADRGQEDDEFVSLNAYRDNNNWRLADCLELLTKSDSEDGRVAELADARDLKSRVPNGACGFESRLGYFIRVLGVA